MTQVLDMDSCLLQAQCLLRTMTQSSVTNAFLVKQTKLTVIVYRHEIWIG